MRIFMCIGIAALAMFHIVAQAESITPWGTTLDAIKANDALAPYRDELIKQARESAAQKIVIRAKTLAEVGSNRTFLDGRANSLEPEIKEQFALAMSDHGATCEIATELPLIAAAYRLTGDPSLRDRVVAQLEETATWSPMQRPGWTLYHPGARLPEDGRDGSWLSTGSGVRAIADMLETMPDGSIEADLQGRLNKLLEAEIAEVVDDWKVQRQWFVRSNNAITNQWVLPTEGLVRACIALGVDSHRDAYELGVKNLLQALDAHGSQGEFEEGFAYASFTVTALSSAARAMAAAGDNRAVVHPFLKNFPTWLVHHFQPGDMTINCFDAGAARDGAERSRPLLAMLSVCTGSPVARWGLTRFTVGPPNTLAGLVTRAATPVDDSSAPPLFAAYERAARVNWRSSWAPDASGVWVRGGHKLDQHDHCDRGHVNFISNGEPILIEAGTPFYHHPLMGSQFASGYGHNVLQLGVAEPHATNAGDTLVMPGWQSTGVVAPISVNRLDAEGGDVTVDITSGYDGLKKWSRNVVWKSDSMTVKDTVELQEGRSEIALFRWHLGTDDDAIVDVSDKTGRASWSKAEIRLEASSAIFVIQTKLPDNTINAVSENYEQDPRHTCVVVQTTEPANVFTLTTSVKRL